MKRAVVVYDTKYGNTRQVGEKIVEGLRQAGGLDIAILDAEETAPNDVADYDLILLGAPNHIGRPSRVMRKFIDAIGELDLKGKLIAVFDTYMGGDFQKAMRRMQEQVSEKIPGVKLLSPGLSIRVEGMRGPISDGEIPKCVEFGARVGSQTLAP